MTARKITLATAWLDGCSGCHMSFLDMDERLIALSERVEIVYSPLTDTKELPARVDVGILEGSISNADDLARARDFRAHCSQLISLGDCAVTGNVPAIRNRFPLEEVLDRAYLDEQTVNLHPRVPTQEVPALRRIVTPVHHEVEVDVFVPGCPPSADVIWYVLGELIEGRTPDPSSVTRFGA